MMKIYKSVLLGCAMLLIVAAFTSCGLQKKNRKSQPAASAKAEQTYRGIVVENDTAQRQLLLRELDSDVIDTFLYGAASVITDKYEEEIAGEDVTQGMILDVAVQRDNTKIVTAKVPEEVWEYQEVSKFSFSSDDNMLEMAGTRYKYTDGTFLSSGDSEISIMDVNEHDVLTIRGIGIYVYSVVKTSGHGYIRLKNYSDFVGGMAVLGDQDIIPITENMLITAAEGSYRLSLSKRGITATKNVTVRSDKETEVDFSNYKAAVSNVGEVTFEIAPDGAELTINRTVVNYSKPIVLNYGKYSIKVSLTGYEEYTGVLDVEEPSKTVRIDLIEQVAKAKDKDESSKTSKPAASAQDDDNTITRQIDSGHTITVAEPAGVEVYLDNVYKGLAPCTFTKVIGTQTITLSDTGYVTKTYSVDILDDGKDVSLSFADLVEAAATEAPETTMPAATTATASEEPVG